VIPLISTTSQSSNAWTPPPKHADEELQRAGAPNYKRVVKRHVLQYMSRLGNKEAKEFAASLPSTQKKGRKSANVKTKEHTLPDIKEVSCCSTPYVCIL